MNIRHILLDGERVTLECKKATKGVPNSLWDTYSAFANTYGGTILLGVVEHMDEQNNTKRFEIVGVEDADKIRKDLWNTVNSYGHENEMYKEPMNLKRGKGVYMRELRECGGRTEDKTKCAKG